MQSRRARKSLFFTLFLALITLATNARAQQWGVYFTATGGTFHLANTNTMYGSTFGFYTQKAFPKLDLGLDFRGTMIASGDANGSFSNQAVDMGLFGPRFAMHPIAGRFIPYAEGLVGRGYHREGVGVTRQDFTAAALEGVGGLDIKIHNSIRWRAAEVTYSRIHGPFYPVHPITYSTGILFAF